MKPEFPGEIDLRFLHTDPNSLSHAQRTRRVLQWRKALLRPDGTLIWGAWQNIRFERPE